MEEKSVKRYKNEGLDPDVKRVYLENKELLKRYYTKPEPIPFPFVPEMPDGITHTSHGYVGIDFTFKGHEYILRHKVRVDQSGFLHFNSAEIELKKHRRIFTKEIKQGSALNFTGFLVNPEMKELTEIKLSVNNPDELKTMLGYEQFNRRAVDSKYEVITDANIFLKQESEIVGWFTYEGYRFANNVLFVPADEDYMETKEEFKTKIKWI